MSPVAVADPLVLDVVTMQQAGADSRGALAVKETDIEIGGAEVSRIVLAMAFANEPIGNQDVERLAADTVLAALSNGQEPDLDQAAALKQAFRAANVAVYERLSADSGRDHPGLSLAALITNDKYASIAIVGDMRGYLARADRLNQVTRDQRTTKPQSRRSQQAASKEKESIRGGQFIGEQERLDSRLPAVFELSLLPEDRVLLANIAVYGTQQDDQLLSIIRGAEGELNALPAGVSGTQGKPALAAVVKAESSRPVTFAPPAAAPQERSLVLPVIVVVILIAIAIVAAYFYL